MQNKFFRDAFLIEAYERALLKEFKGCFSLFSFYYYCCYYCHYYYYYYYYYYYCYYQNTEVFNFSVAKSNF